MRPWRLAAAIAVGTSLAPQALAQAAEASAPPRTFMMEGAYFDSLEDSRCAGGEKRSITGHEPSSEGTYPVFVYVTGTRMKYDGAEALLLTREMAKRGFVAASVEYDNGAYPYCKGMLGKAECIFSQAAKESALSKICARPKANCDAGIVVSGFSQGANLSSLSKNYDPRVKGAYLLGHGSKATNINVTPCMRAAATKLETSEARSVNAEHDVFFGRVLPRVRKQLQSVSGAECDGYSCEQEGGGWQIVQATELADGSADHCYFFHQANGFCDEFSGFDPGWEKGNHAWSLQPNLDWLAAQVSK